MDTLTHALSGALLARALVRRDDPSITRRDAVVLGFCAAAFPDTDVVLSLFSPLAYLYHHRGVTHSLLMLPLWALGLAWLWSRLKRNPAGFRSYLLVSAAAIAIHILGDVITSFGTMILAPFSDARVQWGTTFIIDLWFSGIILAGLIACMIFHASRIPAVASLLLLCGYVSFQWFQQQQAIDFGEAYAKERGIAATSVAALPRPVSPFNWMVVVSDSDRYHYAFVNLHREHARIAGPDAGLIERLDSAYVPVGSARWQVASRFGQGDERSLSEQAWRHAEFSFFRWFSAYPVFAAVEHSNPAECVWFQDLRFLTPGRERWPFRYGMCRAEDGSWSAYQPVEGGERLRLTP